jgi:tetratricopeptide (TPR) repeat protein
MRLRLRFAARLGRAAKQNLVPSRTMNETASPPVASEASSPPSVVPTPGPPQRAIGRPWNYLRAPWGLLLTLVRHPWRTLGVIVLLALIGVGTFLAGVQLWADYHFKKAKEAVGRYHNAEAREHLDACFTVWPDDPDVLFLAARTARRLRAFDRADQYLDEYFRLRGEDEDLTLERVLLKAARGEMDRVEVFCKNLVSKGHPATPLILEALVAGYAHSYRLREAGFCLQKWLELQPDNTQALMDRGLLHELQSHQQEAVDSYRRAVELDPELDEARIRLAACLVDLTQSNEALPHLEHLRRRRPENVEVLLDLARCRDLQGRPGEAERLLEEAAARQPRYGPVLTQLGILTLRQGRLAEAEKWLKKASVEALGDYMTHHHLANCLRLEGKLKEARQVEDHLKQIEADQKRLREIVAHDMPLNPHSAALDYELGMIYLRSGAVAEGKHWLERAVKEDPDYLPARRALAMYYERMGQPGRAQRYREQAGP